MCRRRGDFRGNFGFLGVKCDVAMEVVVVFRVSLKDGGPGRSCFAGRFFVKDVVDFRVLKVDPLSPSLDSVALLTEVMDEDLARLRRATRLILLPRRFLRLREVSVES